MSRRLFSVNCTIKPQKPHCGREFQKIFSPTLLIIRIKTKMIYNITKRSAHDETFQQSHLNSRIKSSQKHLIDN